MKLLLIFLFHLFQLSVGLVNLWAQESGQPALMHWPSVERDGASSIASDALQQRAKRYWDSTTLLTQLYAKGIITGQLLQGSLSAKDLLTVLKKESAFQQTLFQCATQSQLPSAQARQQCEQKWLHHLLIYLRAHQLIDDTACLILKAHIDQHPGQLNYLQQKYLDLPSLFTVQRRLMQQRQFEIKEEIKTDLSVVHLLNPTGYRKKLEPWGKVSARQEFFLRYNSILLINSLATLLLNTEKKMLGYAALVFDYERDGVIDDTIELTSGQRYVLAFNILDGEIVKLTKSDGLFAQQPIEKIHLLMASAEMGMATDGVLKQLYAMPELTWNKPQKALVYLKALGVIAKTAIAATPAGIYLALPIIFIESFFEVKKMKEQKNAPTLFQD